MSPPSFPAPFIIERARALGFGTGPWTRDRLLEAWGAPTADKFISEAKSAGWLVSPSRGVYHVPSAQDVMLVSWLPEPVRQEFLISRTLAAANVRSWCLSAWCRDQGLNVAEPVFVTDLTEEPPFVSPFMRRDAQARAAKAAQLRANVPFIENLLIVPAMPAVTNPVARMALVPESDEALERGRRETAITRAGLGLAGIILYAFDKEAPSTIFTEHKKLEGKDAAARGIPYAVDGRLKDETWIVALLASIGTSRIEELVTKRLKPKMSGRADAIQRWASMFGPPQPVAAWKETLRNGPFPYLLVPPSIWAEMGADQAARRYRRPMARSSR